MLRLTAKLIQTSIMKNKIVFGLAAAGITLLSTAGASANFATSVVNYTEGTGVDPTYTNPLTTLGAPTSLLSYGPVDQFNSPFSSNDIVSIGAGGSLTVEFSTPIQNNSENLFDLDFTIFGNAGFVITNGDYSGGGITDGSLYGASAGIAEVSVSANGIDYYVLDPTLAPMLDNLFPTDSTGNYFTPVDPSLTGGDFAGLDLAGIRALYNGSNGGASYDLSWAQGATLSEARFVRVSVISDKVEIDGFAVVPEPTSMALLCLGGVAVGLWRRRQL